MAHTSNLNRPCSGQYYFCGVFSRGKVVKSKTSKMFFFTQFYECADLIEFKFDLKSCSLALITAGLQGHKELSGVWNACGGFEGCKRGFGEKNWKQRTWRRRVKIFSFFFFFFLSLRFRVKPAGTWDSSASCDWLTMWWNDGVRILKGLLWLADAEALTHSSSAWWRHTNHACGLCMQKKPHTRMKILKLTWNAHTESTCTHIKTHIMTHMCARTENRTTAI